MRVLVASDLHCEFHRDAGAAMTASLDPNGVDVLVLAGDLSTLPILEAVLERLCDRFAHVVYVTGNHEYYGTRREAVHALLSRLAAGRPNLHWLDDGVATIGGQRFVGSTLWFADDPKARPHRRSLNDFEAIHGFADWVFAANAQARSFLERTVGHNDVVVTHHLPTPRSIHPRHVGSPLNAFFVCDLERLITGRQPKLWVHGHTHDSLDYRIGTTRIVCNPFGYAAIEENSAFREDLVIEV